MRVAFLSNYPVPHQRELLHAIEAAGEIELHPFFLAPRDPGRHWGEERSIARARILPSLKLPGLPEEARLHPTLIAELLAARADLTLIGGYSHAAFQSAMAALALLRRPFLIWAELPRIDRGGAALQLARRALIAPLNFSAGLLAVGARAAKTWRSLLLRSIPVVNYSYSCDIDRYRSIVRSPRGKRDFNFLFSGQLIERKGVDVLLRAFIRASETRPDLRLRLAGGGPLRNQLEQMIPEALRDRVELIGLVDWDELPAVYAAADALVVPSRHDGWAMVINEALAAGIPVIASDATGAAFDLIREGMTGYVFRSEDIEALAAAMVRIPEEAEAMGRAARAISANLSTQVAAARLHLLLSAAQRGELRDSLERWP